MTKSERLAGMAVCMWATLGTCDAETTQEEVCQRFVVAAKNWMDSGMGFENWWYSIGCNPVEIKGLLNLFQTTALNYKEQE